MSSTQTQEAPVKRDRTHFLYIAVVAAVILGVIVGFVAPDFAVKLKWIGETFVALVKMMIQPVIFCTLVIGVGSVRSAASVGKVGDWPWPTSSRCRPSPWPSGWSSAT